MQEFCEIYGDIISELVKKENRGLCLPTVDIRGVTLGWRGWQHGGMYLLPSTTTNFSKLAYREGNLGTPRRDSLAYFLLKPRPLLKTTVMFMLFTTER